MEDDNLMPNDGSSFWMAQEPKEQVVARNKEKAQTLEAVNELEKVIQHFQERIEYRDSLSSINVSITEDPALHQKVCAVNDLLKLALIEEKQLLEELLEVHNRNR